MLMMADQPEPELPAEIVEEMTAAGITPSLGNLAAIVAAHRANAAKIVEFERAAALRAATFSLKGLLPLDVDEEVGRVAAAKGRLIAHHAQKGAPWFATVGAVEDWLKETGRWFTSAEDEARWRRDVKARTGKG